MLLTPVYRLCDYLRHRARLRLWTKDAAMGRRAEDLAHRYLQSKGFKVVERNWKHPSRQAEVDLVAWDADRLAFVEVKSRHDTSTGAPERAMNPEKEARIRAAALYFSRHWHLEEDRLRFDLVTVVFEPFAIRHFPDSWSGRAPSGARRIRYARNSSS